MSNKEKVDKTLRSTWLAGLGVYRTGIDSIGEQLDKRYEAGVALFDQCVQRGSELNGELMKPVNRFEQRVVELRTRLGLEQPAVDAQLAKLEQQLELLAERVSVIAEKRAAEQANSLPVKVEEADKSEPKRRPPRTAKPAASKPAAATKAKSSATRRRKPAAKKPQQA